MKKVAFIITIVMVLLTFSSCRSTNVNNIGTVTSSSMFQEEKLCSEAIEHYEAMLKDSWLFSPESEIAIVQISSDTFGVAEEKTDGSTEVYKLEGDIARYMNQAILGNETYNLNHNWTKVYKYRLEMRPDTNTIIGTLIIDTETVIKEQDENGLSYLKEIMLENGIPKAEFKYDNMRIYYGDREVIGVFKDIIMDIMYGFPDIIRCYTNIDVSADNHTIRLDC